MTTNATMISFACEGCGRPFTVPAGYAGRKATCKTCGAKVMVPSSQTADSIAPPLVNGNGKSHPAKQSRPETTAASSRPRLNDADAPTADPTAPPGRTTPIAVISEAQSRPLVTGAPQGETEHSDRAARRELLGDFSDTPVTSAPPAKPRLPMRVRRLMVDAEQVAKVFDGDGPIQIKSAVGDPPELYQIEYKVTGLQRGWLGKPKKRATHLVEIQLTSEYPRVSPMCRMLTPVFHPNIDESTICVGDHWTAGERLVDLIIRIGQMLAYQDYNIKSPLNGEAAMWADLNPKKLPVDTQNLHLADAV